MFGSVREELADALFGYPTASKGSIDSEFMDNNGWDGPGWDGYVGRRVKLGA